MAVFNVKNICDSHAYEVKRNDCQNGAVSESKFARSVKCGE